MQRSIAEIKTTRNGGSCLKKHEKLKIKIFAERVMKNHIYSSTNHLKRRHYRVCSPAVFKVDWILLFILGVLYSINEEKFLGH
jgi:hypothetical protein